MGTKNVFPVSYVGAVFQELGPSFAVLHPWPQRHVWIGNEADEALSSAHIGYAPILDISALGQKMILLHH